MARQFLVALAFAASGSILTDFVPAEWVFLVGAAWGIAMWEAIAFTGRVEARRKAQGNAATQP